VKEEAVVVIEKDVDDIKIKPELIMKWLPLEPFFFLLRVMGVR
jgi:hypothetical protein